jgi:hypothetical protein
MKKWIIASGILIMISGSSFAQQKRNHEKRSPEERAIQMTERLTQELELNEVQKAQVLELQKQHVLKRESDMEMKKAEREAHHSQIEAILTEEQRTKWVEMKDDRKAHQKGRPGGEIHARPGHGKRGSQGGN